MDMEQDKGRIIPAVQEDIVKVLDALNELAAVAARIKPPEDAKQKIEVSISDM
jgi:hypothetical protein